MQHTLRAFDDDISNLRGQIETMGRLAIKAVEQAVEALSTGDVAIAKRVIEDDKKIDLLEQDIDQLAIRTIALRAPMADDLRDIIAALKIASVIERIGDYAKNVSKRVKRMGDSADRSQVDDLVAMGKDAAALAGAAVKAYLDRDEKLALTIDSRDDAIDKAYSKIVKRTLKMTSDSEGAADDIAHALFIAKYFERIGDHATNVAETVYYAATGEMFPEDPARTDDLDE
ncbi:phosphate signaling complex protein PhoU [Sphingomicrobium sediminis]|uniref:Phosphate-specific transport system accessory protein PhoU n=1 Tax=Sphingomicrobium sediminis TaxID=2950949 RepID=A0A9X2EMT7_9SPHN|nr:phosphate signaling complex protein PhoU [Sphingomicrobium sediminis]